jgi:DtxR family Mn-dependent transcriptional regulator
MTDSHDVDQPINNDLSHSMVHYLLSIHNLKEKKGYARVTDIAKALKLTKGSVSTALNNLKKRKLVVEEEDSKFLELSELGHQEVHRILSSRTLLYYFLKDVLKVSDTTSHQDSCMMEHLLSEETREKFFEFMKKYSFHQTQNQSQSENNQGVAFETSLNLNPFKTAKDFIDGQKGDKYLP